MWKFQPPCFYISQYAYEPGDGLCYSVKLRRFFLTHWLIVLIHGRERSDSLGARAYLEKEFGKSLS